MMNMVGTLGKNGWLIRYAMATDYQRLSPIGSGATTCFAAAERGEQGGADEERSDREDRRVSPGKAEALADKWKKQATVLTDQKEFFVEKGYSSSLIKLWETVAGVLADCAVELEGVLSDAPEPDSEAPKERSGRRNVESCHGRDKT